MQNWARASYPSLAQERVMVVNEQAQERGVGLETWDLRDSSSPKHTNFRIPLPSRFCFPQEMSECEQLLRCYCNCRRYIVESTGDLLIVFRYCVEAVDMDGNIIDDMFEYEDSSEPVYGTVRFDVYKLHRQQNKWSYIKSIGDRALFLGINHSLSLSSKDFPELRGNSIYFTDDDLDELRTEETSIGGLDLGIFNLEDNSVKPYYPRGNLQKIIRPPI
ncbi:hypothetical protein F0562_008785 [Nyssa sinensis]|uniref:KIB1-4 beta-propeller domain-containing protein n=1 Tax=Nyssa sinensis TaxID=561372 RepID=A0A5J5AB71_9ASTE|nr:hypothetical protein F0562_008785 [Nyssa sinensis]